MKMDKESPFLHAYLNTFAEKFKNFRLSASLLTTLEKLDLGRLVVLFHTFLWKFFPKFLSFHLKIQDGVKICQIFTLKILSEISQKVKFSQFSTPKLIV